MFWTQYGDVTSSGCKYYYICHFVYVKRLLYLACHQDSAETACYGEKSLYLFSFQRFFSKMVKRKIRRCWWYARTVIHQQVPWSFGLDLGSTFHGKILAWHSYIYTMYWESCMCWDNFGQKKFVPHLPLLMFVSHHLKFGDCIWHSCIPSIAFLFSTLIRKSIN